MAVGTATVDFGNYPGLTEASIVVTGQSAILTTSRVEAFLRQEATTEHSVEELRAVDLKCNCGAFVAGVGFTIYVESRLGREWGTFLIDWVWT